MQRTELDIVLGMLTGVMFLVSFISGHIDAPELRLPPRLATADGGASFASQIGGLPLEAREERIFREVMAGNVPNFLRKFVAVDVADDAGDRGTFYATPDYLAVGSDEDYLFVPMTPYTAQRIADRLRCLLPTPKIVDSIYTAAGVKLDPAPIPPSPAMTTVTVFAAHAANVLAQRRAAVTALGALTAGDKKDIVVCRALADTAGHVAIYGWQKPDGKPIQPLYLGHTATWADYSHGVRLIAETMIVNGAAMRVADVLRDPKLSALVSGEGPIAQPRYAFHHFPRDHAPGIAARDDQRLETFSPVPGVRALIDYPAKLRERVALVIFALPNGNTIEQTFGRRRDPDDDWHYDIQHIGAQTRFVRERLKDQSVVVAYLEAQGHAWPAWLRSHDPSIAGQIVDAVRARVGVKDVHGTLDSHSGGGAFVFAYLRSVDRIPDWIDRIAWLDSEYNYDAALHEAKLAAWLRTDGHYLCVIAYDDASARYQGKPFVSAEGGTWGRSHAMLKDFGREFPIAEVGADDLERYVGLDGRVVFLLKENPRREIFHTVQVERNGFIESLFSGTPLEERGYRYFGDRAYSRYIEP